MFIPFLLLEMTEINVSKLSKWQELLSKDLNVQIATSALGTYDAAEALINRDVANKHSGALFNVEVKPEGSPITSQKASGRCWLFAAGNTFRSKIIEKLSIKEFQFSQSYWFFYDKLERCNYFLTQFVKNIDSSAELDLDSQLIQFFLADPISDGGQFDMFVNIVEKYGAIPLELYPDAFSATSTRTMNFLLKSKLREFAEILRKAKKDNKEQIGSLKEQMVQELYRLLSILLTKPPLPNDSLTWEYKNTDGEVKAIDFTPLLFYKETLNEDLSEWISLLNDPRNDYDKRLKIDKLNNVLEGRDVSYLNISADELAEYAVKTLKNNDAVFFGTHSPIFMDRKRGVMDEKLYNYNILGFSSKQDKASRIRYKQSLMTHAMVIVGVHLDEQGSPVRWKVENSWGKDSGQSGYYVMDNQYLKDYVYQIVVRKSTLLSNHKELIESDLEPVTLPPWDPMGALA